MILIIAYGASYTGGTIQCNGGAGSSDVGDGGGGGGGHIEIYAKTASFGTLSVAGGSGPGSATDGGTGTTLTVNLNTYPDALLGGLAGNDAAGVLLQWCPVRLP